MGYIYKDLQAEVKRRAFKDQSGTTFTTATKRLINFSLLRVTREAFWKSLRRKAFFTTIADYSTGTATFTNASATVTGSGTSWLANAKPGQRISNTTAASSTRSFFIKTVDSDTQITMEENYDGTTGSAQTYTIFGPEEYNLPIDMGRMAIVWHEKFGYPFPLSYVPDPIFFKSGNSLDFSDTPTNYRLWGADTVVNQPTSGSVMRITSSDADDTSLDVMIHGIVADYPDFERITTNGSNGTTAVSGSKTFTRVERITVEGNHEGRITVDSNSAAITVATVPVGETAAWPYQKIQVFPHPGTAILHQVLYYKKPQRLVEDEDVHELGGEFDEVIILGAIVKALQAERQGVEADRYKFDYLDELRSLKRDNAENLDFLARMILRGNSPRRHDLLAPGVLYQQLGSRFGPSVAL